MAEKKMNYAERIIAWLKGGDAKNINRFQKYTKRYIAEEIGERERLSDKLQDKLDDLDGKLEETVHNVDLDVIKDTDNLENYSERYVQGIFSVYVERKELEERIETLGREVEIYKKALKEIS